jgi:SAM-dependent methyltransferase/catechol 2,3-dioxygenase-like lactoylglutathione lyase family enzyme
MTAASEIYGERMAREYDRGRHLLPEAEDVWAHSLDGLVAEGARVVDIGAGTGRFAGLFARRLGCRVVAVEPSAEMRAAGRSSEVAGVVWAAGAAESLPLRSGTADLVWMSCIVHYLDLVRAGREAARVLAPGGRVLVRSDFPDRFDDQFWIRWFPAARAVDEVRMPTVEAIAAAWAPSGLRLEARLPFRHPVARNLDDLADRFARRAISTLTLISDDEYERGMAALRADARREPAAPVFALVDLLVFVPDRPRIDLATVVVDDYDEAIAFFVGALGFDLAEDTPAVSGAGNPSNERGRVTSSRPPRSVLPAHAATQRAARATAAPIGAASKRWVVVRPPGGGTGLLLARADGERQAAAVGEQAGGRVGFFLRVDDVPAAYERLRAAGVVFEGPPRREAYGRVAVFRDVAGNRWDLVGPR